MPPKTLEEALQVINQLNGQVADLVQKNKDVIQEKKDAIKIFTDKQKEDMSEGEKTLAETLEIERAERVKLQNQIDADNAKRVADDKARVTKAIEARIVKISKGDTTVADKLRQNVALLNQMPTGSDEEIDAIATSAFNMLGTKEANPLAAVNNGTGGDVRIDSKPNFADTDAGKAMAAKLGLSVETKSTEQK